MTKFTVAACVAVFALGAVVGRATAPGPEQAKAYSASYELTLKAGALPLQVFDAI